MTAGWVLPRDWDAGRLLRFLTGLALLALAFAGNAGLIVTPAGPALAATAPAAVTVDAPATADVAGADVALDVAPDAADQAAPAPASADVPVVAAQMIANGDAPIEPVVAAEPAGAAPGAHGSRAPPAV
jgi:hypothetical protein